jgi:diadenosine tetraphosphate (Ap4A) HIT family hydrolase
VSDATWTLHPQLAADTHPVARLGLSDVLLMDNAANPWLILVPRIAGAIELIDLDEADQHRLLGEIALAGRVLRRLHHPDKLNIAALGNVVSQLHVHVIARFTTDVAWPRPVWGATPPRPYGADDRLAHIEAYRLAFSDAAPRTAS